MTKTDYERMSVFTCGVSEIDKFFRYEIEECVKNHYLSAYCAIGDSQEIVAVFTLMNDALMITSNTEKEDFIDDLRFEVDDDIVEFFNRQSSYPAVNIGHLGVSEKWQCHGIGTIIMDFVAETFANHHQTGCQFITVDALNNAIAVSFYRKNSFNFQTNRDFYSPTRRMYRIL